MGVHLTQTQHQLCAVIHGDGVRVQLCRFLSQTNQTCAVEIQAICCYIAGVTNVH
ncbi:hypothetical protein D3C75_1370480 [compost metagenome]